jgi:hypothetical protein
MRWTYGRYSDGGNAVGPLRIWDETGRVIADIPVEKEADASLMAAAPNSWRLARRPWTQTLTLTRKESVSGINRTRSPVA